MLMRLAEGKLSLHIENEGNLLFVVFLAVGRLVLAGREMTKLAG